MLTACVTCFATDVAVHVAKLPPSLPPCLDESVQFFETQATATA